MISAALVGKPKPSLSRRNDGDPLITTTNPKQKLARGIRFPSSNTIAVTGDLASVKAALDRSTASNSIDPALAAQS